MGSLEQEGESLCFGVMPAGDEPLGGLWASKGECWGSHRCSAPQICPLLAMAAVQRRELSVAWPVRAVWAGEVALQSVRLPGPVCTSGWLLCSPGQECVLVLQGGVGSQGMGAVP